MQMPNIMQGLSLELFLIAEIGYIWFRSRGNRNTPTLSAFFRLCSALMLFLVIDFPVRLSDLNLVSWDPTLTFVLNALYIGLETLTIFEWFIYFLTVQEVSFLRDKWINRFYVTIPLDIMVILLALSYKTHWLFYIDESGAYTRGSLFFLQFMLPFLYLFASLASTIIVYRKNKNKRVFFILLSAFCISVVTSVLQVLFSGSFTHAGLCLAVNLVYLEMYQEEIKRLEKMKSLAVVNERLEDANAKLNATVRELEISIANEKEANNAKNDFLSRMSHDIRTPLNGILGILEIDDKHPDDVALLTENRKKARIAAKHLASLVNDVLDMSKLSTGKYELAHEPFVMSELLSDVLSIVKSRAAGAGITLINENAEDTYAYPATYGSSLHIRRVLINIIGNGIKYNKKDGSVRVKLAHSPVEDKYIKYTLTVADTGIGMSEEFVKKMFEPFSQERIDARSVYEGTGLGMTITKALIDKMGGTIRVETEEGKGSTFIIDLTFEIAQTDKQTTEEEETGAGIEGLRILLAEDNELNTEIAVTLLEDAGAKVTAAENGKVAYDLFMQNPPGTFDVILMDCMMPIWDGYAATKAIREADREDAKTLPIIAMTANAFADDVKKCLESGMNDHISKPFEIEKTVKTVAKHVR